MTPEDWYVDEPTAEAAPRIVRVTAPRPRLGALLLLLALGLAALGAGGWWLVDTQTRQLRAVLTLTEAVVLSRLTDLDVLLQQRLVELRAEVVAGEAERRRLEQVIADQATRMSTRPSGEPPN